MYDVFYTKIVELYISTDEIEFMNKSNQPTYTIQLTNIGSGTDYSTYIHEFLSKEEVLSISRISSVCSN